MSLLLGAPSARRRSRLLLPLFPDPFWDQVELLLNCNGTNGQTTFLDSSNAGRTVTANGNAQISTANFKYGGASGLFDGSGDFLTITHDAVFNNLTNPFTMEAWLYVETSHKTEANIFGKREIPAPNPGWLFWLRLSGSPNFFMRNTVGGNYVNLQAPSPIPVDEWVHLAITFDGTTYTIWQNGTSIASTSTTTGVFQPSNVNLRVGRDDLVTGRDWDGFIDDARFTSACRYTGSFTPPKFEAAEFMPSW